MLAQSADFPFIGSTAFLRGTAEEARIIRHNGDGTALISIPERKFHSERASGNRTVDLADLYKTAEEAMFCGRRQRRGRR